MSSERGLVLAHILRTTKIRNRELDEEQLDGARKKLKDIDHEEECVDVKLMGTRLSEMASEESEKKSGDPPEERRSYYEEKDGGEQSIVSPPSEPQYTSLLGLSTEVATLSDVVRSRSPLPTSVTPDKGAVKLSLQDRTRLARQRKREKRKRKSTGTRKKVSLATVIETTALLKK